jgi:integrase
LSISTKENYMRKSKKVRRRTPSIPPFTDDEVRMLIAAANDWWKAFVLLTWESGQELADLSNLRWSQVAADGTVSMVRAKTGCAVTFRLSSEAMAAARSIGDADRVLPWDATSPLHFPRAWRQFVASVDGVRPLSAKYLRLAAIQRTVREQGVGVARRLLGRHSPLGESGGQA